MTIDLLTHRQSINEPKAAEKKKRRLAFSATISFLVVVARLRMNHFQYYRIARCATVIIAVITYF